MLISDHAYVHAYVHAVGAVFRALLKHCGIGYTCHNLPASEPISEEVRLEWQSNKQICHHDDVAV